MPSAGVADADELAGRCVMQSDGAADSNIAFLLTSAATDFHLRGPPGAVRFRAVRSGYLMTGEGARQHRLCGEFLPADRAGPWSAPQPAVSVEATA